jgi:hypothetical protein
VHQTELTKSQAPTVALVHEETVKMTKRVLIGHQSYATLAAILRQGQHVLARVGARFLPHHPTNHASGSALQRYVTKPKDSQPAPVLRVLEGVFHVQLQLIVLEHLHQIHQPKEGLHGWHLRPEHAH